MKLRRRLSPRPLLWTRVHLSTVLPLVEKELDQWRARGEAIPDSELRRQALASIDQKRFHCQGGSLFAAWEPTKTKELVAFIVAFQTISDYLDNLCDRTDSLNEQDFRTLHRSMTDAVSLKKTKSVSYYRYHPNQDDGGYLQALVSQCRRILADLPRYARVEGVVTRLVSLYVDLQVYKHLSVSVRRQKLEAWFDQYADQYPQLMWWEFAAATGSTLGVYALMAEAARLRPIEDMSQLVAGYFPWICGLHILLDYLIDQKEDAREGDLNFVSYYPDPQSAQRRISWILKEAIHAASKLSDAPFHLTVIEGLLGLYLSDPKVRSDGLWPMARALVAQGGWRARLVHAYCVRWRLR